MRRANRNGERSRDALIEAAIAVIAERGVAGASVGDICARAGLARTALYWHFGDRDGLLAAVIDRVGGLWVDEILKRASREGNPFARLDRVLEAWARLVVEKPDLLRLLLFVQLDRTADSAATRDALTRVFRRTLRALAQGLEQAVGLPIDGADVIAHTMIGLLMTAVLRRGFDPEGASLECLWGDLRRTVWLGVASRMPAEFAAVGPDQAERPA